MRPKVLSAALLMIVVSVNCIAQGTWLQRADFGGNPRFYAVGFSIGDKGYLGTGYTNTYENYGYSDDFWEYDPVADTWTQKADFGGIGRVYAVGFGIGNKGYIGLGEYFNGATAVLCKDFWEYDPAANKWTRKTDFGGTARTQAAGFNINDKAYVGTGRDVSGATKDFWEYDPAANIWVQKADFSGSSRSDAKGFSIGDKGYIGIGWDGTLKKDFWEYDHVANSWRQKADFTGMGRIDAVGFSIGNKGYIGIGYGSGNDFWEYDPLVNMWMQKQNFPGNATDGAVGFSIGSKGYMGTGEGADLYKDFWEYIPDAKCASPEELRVAKITDTSAVLRWVLPTEPVASFKIRYRAVGTLELMKQTVKGTSNHLLICGLAPGTTYEWQIRSNCSTDTSNWVRGPDFKTASSFSFPGIANNIYGVPGSAGLRIIPNPVKSNFTIHMQVPEKELPTALSLYDGLGQRIWQQSLGNVKGQIVRNIALGNTLSAGIYTLKVERSDMQLMLKVIVN